MVIDKDNGKSYPRYLVYDIIMLEGRDVSRQDFFPNRYNLIQNEIIEGRNQACLFTWARKDREPFSVRAKSFYDVIQTRNLLSEKFTKCLSHEPDGLIFQPAKEPYVTGPCDDVLKWKPSTLNSVDFKLVIVKDEGPGIVPQRIGQLWVGSLQTPFAIMKVTKEMYDLHNKIIECKYQNKQWVFMRERTDKSFPNSYNTARSVCGSIVNPVTKHGLIDYIDRHRFKADDAELMPPPKK